MFQFPTLPTPRPLLFGAIHMPAFVYGTSQDLRKIETWLLRNVENYIEGGFDSVMLQDNTPRCPGLETKSLVYISALSYAVSSRFPDFPLGLIIESNDAQNAVTIAAAAHFQYVRCKVFVGAMQKPGGMMDGNAAEAFHFRKMVDRDISLFADIFDRMGAPLYDRDYPLAISQAKKYGADAAILTGASFEESCQLLDAARKQFPLLPLLLGGGVDETNLHEAARHCDGMVVSSSLTKDGSQKEWDRQKISRISRLLKS